MYTNILSPNTKNLLNILSKTDSIRDFYLTGGTALSLLIGHRESQDLDFFNQKSFEPELIQKKLETVGNLKSVSIEAGTLNCFLDNVKLQFLYYPYSLLEPILD